MSLRVEPRVVDNKYDYAPYFSIGIKWNPMDSMKTEIIDEYGDFRIE